MAGSTGRHLRTSGGATSRRGAAAHRPGRICSLVRCPRTVHRSVPLADHRSAGSGRRGPGRHPSPLPHQRGAAAPTRSSFRRRRRACRPRPGRPVPVHRPSRSRPSWPPRPTTGPLSAADDAAIVRAEQAMRAVPQVTGRPRPGLLPQRAGPHRPSSRSTSRTSGGGKDGCRRRLRAAAAFATAGAPAGLAMHLTGGLAPRLDEQNQNGHIQTLIELLSVLFIVALLLPHLPGPVGPVHRPVPVGRGPHRRRPDHRRVRPTSGCRSPTSPRSS